MLKKFVHIGMGRTSNMTLIHEIYPMISKFSNYKFFHSNFEIQNQIDINYEKIKLGEEINTPLNINENMIISDERLIGWNPYDWEKYANANLKMFGEDSTILITLRDPYQYINSMYSRQCLVHGNLMTPNEYYLLKDNYNSQNENSFYLEGFSYFKIKKIYEARFNKVIFVDYKDLKTMDFFAEYFKLNMIDKNKLKFKYQEVRSNKSYLTLSSKITTFLYYILRIFALIFYFNFFKNKFKKLKIKSVANKINNHEILELNIKLIKKMSELDIKHNFYSKIVNLIKWQDFMFFIDKIFESKKNDIFSSLDNQKINIISKCKDEYIRIIERSD